MIHSFLMIGQSNMAGRGNIGDVEPIRNPELKVLRNGRWQPFFTPVNFDRPFSGISLAESFADAYQRDHGVSVGLIPCADGGTQLEQWREGSLLFDHAVFQTRLAERTSTVAGILWHQGESDCKAGRCETYLERLEAFYKALTGALGLEDVPFIVGGLGDFLSEREEERDRYLSINRQLQCFADAHPMTGFASAAGLEGKPDHLHFSAVSQRLFGLRYYAVFRDLEDRERVFQEKPCEDDALRTGIESL
ncbi:MAG: sialate O-acetylesterase [Clostridia bacterium]|nr:sialate O-acetylesterase [Clostridia bacterium]